MRAWVFRQKGNPSSVLHLESEHPDPSTDAPAANKHKVLVKVHAASLNPIGFKSMGVAPIKWGQKVPAIPECDFSGTVAGGDLSGTGLQVGDAVFGIVPAQSVMKAGQGVLADYTLVEKHLVVKKPDNVSFEEASTFPLVTFTAYQMMMRTGGLKKGTGQRVFINGGSGGVGVYAVQLAKAYGAYVVTTCSPQSRDLVQSLGPDEILDYKERDLVQQLTEKYKDKPFDMVFDTVGANSELYPKSPRYLKPKGHFLDIAGPHMDGSIWSLLSSAVVFAGRLARPRILGGTPRKYVFAMMEPEERELKEMAEFLREGKLKPIIDEVFPFEKAIDAYKRQMSGRAKGKVVVKVADA
ncbi:hypothetical protein Rhopal_002355-T1 [Rhodotorula paludigena]|uniref:Enoyl reductase (ER) domain-containing protein n=1 Tax=Rhodotorula paludigena TaxID=86838 RepID=A0AAV5GA07_9BASI|nr:hypothetical protein Rhopal_002355-T1 [Rhodotorula paludigena]